jgi:hypothetical protein
MTNERPQIDRSNNASTCLVGPRQVQAMLMEHKGNVVFEIYPGMNPNDIHVWMSASPCDAGTPAGH